MKKIVIFCTVLSLVMILGSIVYASKWEKVRLRSEPADEYVVKCDKQLELFPSLFFF